MCTSIGDRKMLICSHDPGGAASGTAGPATSTRPSAGDSTASASPGDARSGSRKKKAKNAPSATNGIASTHATAAPDTTASSSAPPMNGRPAGSSRITERDPDGRTGGAPAEQALR